MFDFVDVFNNTNLARFYIFIYSALVFLTLMFVAFLQAYPIPKFVVIGVLHISFIVYVLVAKPFQSKWNNFKSVTIHLMLVVFVACNLAIVGNSQYNYGLELGVVIGVCVALIVNVGLYVPQVIFAYYE